MKIPPEEDKIIIFYQFHKIRTKNLLIIHCQLSENFFFQKPCPNLDVGRVSTFTLEELPWVVAKSISWATGSINFTIFYTHDNDINFFILFFLFYTLL